MDAEFSKEVGQPALSPNVGQILDGTLALSPNVGQILDGTLALSPNGVCQGICFSPLEAALERIGLQAGGLAGSARRAGDTSRTCQWRVLRSVPGSICIPPIQAVGLGVRSPVGDLRMRFLCLGRPSSGGSPPFGLTPGIPTRPRHGSSAPRACEAPRADRLPAAHPDASRRISN